MRLRIKALNELTKLLNFRIQLLIPGGGLCPGSLHFGFEGGFLAGFGPQARDKGSCFGSYGRGLSQLGPELGNVALAHGFAGFQSLELVGEVGLHLLTQVFEMLLFFAAGGS